MKEKHIAEEKIVDYILGNLSTNEHFSITSHVKECQQCADTLKLWENLLSEQVAPVPSSSTKEQLMNQTKKWRVKKIPIYLASASVLIFVFLFASLLNPSNKTDITVDERGEITAVEEKSFYSKINIQPTKALQARETIEVNTQELKSLPTYKQSEVHGYYMNQFLFFQSAPLCVFNEEQQAFVCYKYNPMTDEFYPLFKMK